MMKTLEMPTISETKRLAGVSLATILFEQCHPELKTDYGLAPYLEGPQGDLWVSPNDLLKGEIVLSPSPTEKHMYALSHEAVLDLGFHVEQKFINHMKIAKETALKELEDFLRSVFATEKAELLDALRKEEELKYGSQLLSIRTTYEDKICQDVWQCFEQVSALEEEMMNEIASMNVVWRQRVEQEIEATTTKLTEEFLHKMRLQEQVLVNIFTNAIRTIKKKQKCAIDFERMKCTEKMKELRHKLGCQNLADLMYLLCKERRRCQREKNDIRKHYSEQVREMKLTVKQKSEVVKKLSKLRNKRVRQIKVRERCLIEILRQYQKFIYFALRAAPTQGEFLLNINELLKYELRDYCLPKASKTDHLDMRVITEKEEDYDAEIEEFLQHSWPSADEEYEGSDVLPAFYYNNKMYVREDFRDMFAVGLEIDRKHPLWNPDVEELLTIFRKNIEKDGDTCQIEKVTSHSSIRHFDSRGNSPIGSEDISVQIQAFSPESSTSSSPRRFTPPAGKNTNGGQPRMTSRPSVQIAPNTIHIERDDSEDAESGITSKRSSLSRNFEVNPGTQSRLTLARDSIIMAITAIERKSIVQGLTKIALDNISKSGSDKDKVSKDTQDEELQMVFDKESEDQDNGVAYGDLTGSLQNEPTAYRPSASKLLLACDSVDLIKSKLDLTVDKDKEKPPQKGERRKSALTFSPKISITGSDVERKPSPPKITKKAKPGKSGKPPGSKKVSPYRKKVTPAKSVASRSVTKPKIAGAQKEKEHAETVEEFTNERITDLVDMMKEDPSLIRLFTQCHQ